jgi:DNA-binding IclR family transcriptional regulator
VLLRHPEEKRYSLGPRLIEFGEAARRGYTAVDFAPPVLEALAAQTGCWARAWRVQGDLLVRVAAAGAPTLAAAPMSVPLAPPAGTAVMAWSDALTRDAWLARAASIEVVAAAAAALPTVRESGYAVTLASDEWRSLTGPLRVGAAARSRAIGLAAVPAVGDGGNGGDGGDRRRALLLAVSRQGLVLADVDDAASYVVADVAAPVFGVTGEVVLALSVTTVVDEALPGAAVRSLGRQVAHAGDALTAATQGRRPDASVDHAT